MQNFLLQFCASLLISVTRKHKFCNKTKEIILCRLEILLFFFQQTTSSEGGLGSRFEISNGNV